MNEDCLKLTVYLGERHRSGRRFVADALTDIYASHELQTSLLMRGIEGFGGKHRLRTDRLLSLSEDLPLVSVAVDSRERVHQALAEVNELPLHGLVTLERARMLTGRLEAASPQWPGLDASKLTIYVGRHERRRGRPAYEAIVALLRERGIAGATVLLGVDGTVHGARRRARFFARNAAVPLMVIAVGDSRNIAQTIPELGSLLERPLLTLERATVCKRDGAALSEPPDLPESDPSGVPIWQKLMIYTSEQSKYNGLPVHQGLIRELRRAGASGATCLRGIWGYHGDRTPHGDSFLQLRRHVPVLTVVVDTPARVRRWFTIVDRLTSGTGLVTSEIVPAFRAGTPEFQAGGFRLAQRLPWSSLGGT